MKKALVLITIFFLLSSSTVLAQDFCKGDFDYNGAVDAEDVTTFLENFGRNLYNNPCPPDGPAPVEKTGQTACYTVSGIQTYCAGSGQDGEYQKGIEWPNPRLADNGDGTVTDNLTGLMWTKDANLPDDEVPNLQEALDYVIDMNDEEMFGYDDWRICNVRELSSLIDYSGYMPTLPAGHPFQNVQANSNQFYWSSTTHCGNHTHVYCVLFMGGAEGACNKGGDAQITFLWPVRGGQ